MHLPFHIHFIPKNSRENSVIASSSNNEIWPVRVGVIETPNSTNLYDLRLSTNSLSTIRCRRNEVDGGELRCVFAILSGLRHTAVTARAWIKPKMHRFSHFELKIGVEDKHFPVS